MLFRSFDQVTRLGPAYFGLERTGDAIVAMIEGVEQLEIYFGQYLPQLMVSILTPFLIFGVLVFFDVPIALVMLAAALFTLIAPQVFHRWDGKKSLERGRDYKAFAAEFLDSVQGLATLKAFGQSTNRAQSLKIKARALFRSTMWVLATNSLARGITDIGITLGAAGTLAYGAHRVVDGEMSLAVLLIVLMLASMLRDRLRLRYELWRVTHGLGALLVAGLGAYHAVSVGRYTRGDPVLAGFWLALVAAAEIGRAHV